MNAKEAHNQLVELIAHPGWNYLKAVMQNEIVTAAFQLAEPKPITDKEMDFKRGALWAARKLIELPERQKQVLENEMLLEAAKDAEN